MDNEKISEILKNAKPEIVDLQLHRSNLRRELLNSDHFKRPTWKKVLSLKIALRVVAIITVIVIIILTDFTPREISAKDIIKNLEKVYNDSFIPGKVNYTSGVFIVYGQNRQNVNFKFENWKDSKSGKRKIIKRDLQTGEILDFKIFDGSKMFKLEDSRIKIIKFGNTDDKNLVVSGSSDKLFGKLFLRKEKIPLNISKDSIGNSKMSKTISIVIQEQNILRQKIFAEGSSRIFIRTSFTDVDEMSDENPRDIVEKLKTQSDFNYQGSILDEQTGQKLILLRRVSLLDSLPQDRVMIYIEKNNINAKQSDTCSRLRKYSIYDESGGREKVYKGEKRETIMIDSETGRIFKIKITIVEKGKEDNLSEITFNDDRFIDYDDAIFNPLENNVIRINEDKK